MSKPNPFRYFKTSPEIIRLAVMMYVRFPLSLRNVEDLLHERAMQRFRQMRSLQKFAAVHSSVYNHFNSERSLTARDHFKETRSAALNEWRSLGAA